MTRAIAAKTLLHIFQGQSLAHVLPSALSTLAAKDRAFVQALCYGVCRFYPRLDFYLQQLLKKPLRGKDQDIYALLLIGLLQLTEMRVPHHAAVAETVAACKTLKKTWAQQFVNGVLRTFIRQQDQLVNLMQQDEVAYYAHPKWWIEKIKTDYPQQWSSILPANNALPPMVLRVNSLRISRAAYLQSLTDAKLAAHAVDDTPSAIELEKPVAVEQLPGFAEGLISIQDAAAQRAAALLQLAPQQRVLDACAAPGGKLFHLAEVEPHLREIVAVEKDPQRLASILQNQQRLRPIVPITFITGDASKPIAWWDNQLFERILLDAPCSGSGVIRRHPDIKLLRRERDIAAAAQLQLQLLTHLWPLLKLDDYLLYVTCSIFHTENRDVIAAFLTQHQDAQLDFSQQILPGENNQDGFFYARLRKRS